MNDLFGIDIRNLFLLKISRMNATFLGVIFKKLQIIFYILRNVRAWTLS